jgi:hypothetical protein
MSANTNTAELAQRIAELPEILREAAKVIDEIDVDKFCPPSFRYPLIDELEGFALMLDATLAAQAPLIERIKELEAQVAVLKAALDKDVTGAIEAMRQLASSQRQTGGV